MTDKHTVINAARSIEQCNSMPVGEFVAWLDANFECWDFVEREALALAKQVSSFSVYQLREAARWDYGWGFTNSVTPYLARLLVALHPGLAGFVEIIPTRNPDKNQLPLF